MSIVVYDIDPSGHNPPFHQILHFAASLIDNELKELDRFDIRVRLLPHLIPDPESLMLRRATIDQLTHPALLPFYDAICAIRHKLLSWAPAIFLGYNSYRVAEHFLRQSFYKTLHPPHLTNTNGNARTDVMRIVQGTSVFFPRAVAIPVDRLGRQTFDLADVARANGLNPRNALDPRSRVRTTTSICRLLMERTPSLWSHFMRFSQKAAVLDYIRAETVFCMGEVYFGKPYSWHVTALGANTVYDSEYYVYDLSVDPQQLLSLSSDALARRLRRRPKPIRRLRCNGAPIIIPIDDAQQLGLETPLAVDKLEQRAEDIKSDPLFRDRLISSFEALQAHRHPSPYVEEQIYDGFPSSNDREIMQTFHRVPWEERLQLIRQLEDRRMFQLGIQLTYFERPDLLDHTTRAALCATFAERLMSPDANLPWLTLSKAIEKVDNLLATSDSAGRKLLLSYREYLSTRVRNGGYHQANSQAMA